MLNEEWLKAFLPVGVLRDAQWAATGAGFLLSDDPFAWVVTAKHVVAEVRGADIGTFVSKVNGDIEFVNLSDAHRNGGLGWHLHESEDVAVGLMPLDTNWDIKALSRNHCIGFSQITPSSACYTVGCPYGLPGLDPTRNTPLVLDGIVSGTSSSPKRIYTSAPTFPGNSGGPLVIVQAPFNPVGGLTVGGQIVFVGGVMSQTALIPNPNDSSFPPLHLGIATPIEFAWELVEREPARAQKRKLIPL